MKSERYTTKQTDRYDDCPQKRPIIQQFLKFVSTLHNGYTPAQPLQNNTKENVNPVLRHPDELVINADAIQTTSGLARSIVFFNWRDYA